MPCVTIKNYVHRTHPSRPCLRITCADAELLLWLDTQEVFSMHGLWPLDRLVMALKTTLCNQDALLDDWLLSRGKKKGHQPITRP